MKSTSLVLPKISKHKIMQTTSQDEQLVAELETWSRNIPKVKSKNNMHLISYLYKQNILETPRRASKMPENYLTEVTVFLAQLNNDLNRIKNIDYQSIHRNVQYCCGLYENEFNSIFKKLCQFKQKFQNLYKDGLAIIQSKRKKHIQMMENLDNILYKNKIRQVRQSLQNQQQELKPLKKLIKTLYLKKQFLLKFCLTLGYDVRTQGLVWILKELKRFPKSIEFPNFLNQQQINYILKKYQRYLLQQSQVNQQKQNQGTAIETLQQTYQKVTRKKRRQLSTIKQQQILSKMQLERAKSLGDLRKYLQPDTMQMVQQMSNKIKATKYEIIYGEASKKLNKICHEKIHGIKKNRMASRQTLELVEKFNNLLSDNIVQNQKEEEIRNGQQKQLANIIKKLRMEKYKDGWKNRNPITIICCLVGWKKTKKIMQQQFNIFL